SAGRPKRTAPPTTRSSSTVVGNHCASWAGSVTARHTASTGWARWRSSRTAQRPPRASISSSRMSVLRVAVEVAFERVEVLLPQPAVRRQPGVDLRERLGAQLVASLLGLHVGADQAGLAQDLQ